METTNHNNHAGDSSDDEIPIRNNKPVNFSTTLTRRHLNHNHSRLQGDSGIELDQTSSSSTIFNQRANTDRLLFPPTDRDFDETTQPTLLRRIQNQRELDNENFIINQNKLSTNFNPTNRYWNRLKQKWFRALLIGFFILSMLFFIYFFGLDSCSRSTIIQIVWEKIIRFESEGIPTF
jgi:lipopolysaccharide export LptBFGC system permease protein LptF